MFLVPFPARLTRAIAMLAALLGLACMQTRDPCIPGGEAGRKYDVHLSEVYDSSVTDVLYGPQGLLVEPTCGALDTLGPGSELPFTISASTLSIGMLCLVHEASVTLPVSVQVESDGVAISQSGFYQNDIAIFVKDVQIGSCAGTMELDFRNVAGDVFAAPSPTGLPPFVVERFFRPTDVASCPALGALDANGVCGDTWVATLTAQQ